MFFSIVWEAEVFEATFLKSKICVLPFPIPKIMTCETENYEKGKMQKSIDTGKENYIFSIRFPECGSSSLFEGPAFINMNAS